MARWKVFTDANVLGGSTDVTLYEPERWGLASMSPLLISRSSEFRAGRPSDQNQLEHSDVILAGVHDPKQCVGQSCTIHNRSDHSMRAFPQHWRDDRKIMERICPHGVGHPDPDDYYANHGVESVHGCCGHRCCS